MAEGERKEHVGMTEGEMSERGGKKERMAEGGLTPYQAILFLLLI